MFCYTAELDELLHREGCSGAGVLQRLDACAGRLEALERGAARRGEKHRLYLLSDHGMVDVHATLDVMVGAMVRLARQLEPGRFA